MTTLADAPASSDGAGVSEDDALDAYSRVIVEIDGSAVVDVGELQALMTAARIGRSVSVKVVRGGEVRDLELHPAELSA